jgi:GAF domain-containing protein
VPESQDRLAAALAEITVRLVDDHDVDTVLRLVTAACADLLGAAATGVLVVDPRGGTQVVSASDDRSRFVELLQAQTEQGPCVECVRTGSVVHSADLRQDVRRWPAFVPEAVTSGFLAIHAIPLHLDGLAVGGLNLLFTAPRALRLPETRLAKVLADLTVLGLSQERAPRRADLLVERTLRALDDRVLLDHATGLVSGALDVDPEVAKTAIRDHARRTGRPVHEVARAVTDGALEAAELVVRPGGSGNSS